MVYVRKGRWIVLQFLTAIMAFFLDFRSGPAGLDHQATKSGVTQVSGGFRLPISTAYAYFPNQDFITTVKNKLMENGGEMTSGDIDQYTNRTISKSQRAQEEGDLDALLKSTKGLMNLNEALDGRVNVDTGQTGSNSALDSLYNEALKARNAGDVDTLKNVNTQLMERASGLNGRITAIGGVSRGIPMSGASNNGGPQANNPRGNNPGARKPGRPMNRPGKPSRK